MACEILECCQFFNDRMAALPKTAEYIKQKLCSDDYERCSRFRIYKEFGGKDVPPEFDPADVEDVEKVLQCLRKQAGLGG